MPRVSVTSQALASSEQEGSFNLFFIDFAAREFNPQVRPELSLMAEEEALCFQSLLSRFPGKVHVLSLSSFFRQSHATGIDRVPLLFCHVVNCPHCLNSVWWEERVPCVARS